MLSLTENITNVIFLKIVLYNREKSSFMRLYFCFRHLWSSTSNIHLYFSNTYLIGIVFITMLAPLTICFYYNLWINLEFINRLGDW